MIRATTKKTIVICKQTHFFGFTFKERLAALNFFSHSMSSKYLFIVHNVAVNCHKLKTFHSFNTYPLSGKLKSDRNWCILNITGCIHFYTIVKTKYLFWENQHQTKIGLFQTLLLSTYTFLRKIKPNLK